MTTGNSSPFALWTVIRRTPPLPSSRTGASADAAVSAASLKASTKPLNEMPPSSSVLPRELRHVQNVRERLLSRAPKHETDVSPRRLEQIAERVGNRTIVPPPMQPLEKQKGLSNRLEMRALFVGGGRLVQLRNAERMKSAMTFVPVEQILVSDREQRAAQRREHRQLVVRPLDRRQRGADGLDLLALVEALPADEDMRNPAGIQRVHVRPRDVVSERDEAPEQHADVAGSHSPAASRDQPLDERPNRIWQ